MALMKGWITSVLRHCHKISTGRSSQVLGASFFAIFTLSFLAGCVRPDPRSTSKNLSVTTSPTAITALIIDPTPTRTLPTPTLVQPTDTSTPAYIGTPTPDPTRPLKEGDPAHYDIHIVSAGETLSLVALLYKTSVEELVEINELSEDEFLTVGQQLLVPGGILVDGPSFKIIPDSELVYGPALLDFDITRVVGQNSGYLSRYREVVEGQDLAGLNIIQLVANRQSISPRLLLAVLEYQAGWLTRPSVIDDEYPLGFVKDGYEGLYQQLVWAGNKLNQGFYGRSEGGLTFFEIADGKRVNFARDINDGSAGVQYLFGAYPSSTYRGWLADIGPNGFYATYNQLFGNPFAYTVEPLWPEDLTQPSLLLPWAKGETWNFTGGPHGGWASGSAWAAIDFAPPDDRFGCYSSDAWVTTMSDGLVIQSDFGAVVVDLDEDGFAGTGWVVTYLHLATRERVPEGTVVQAGDPLGHPSCEGGYSNGTHVHISRIYNGKWVSADGDIPFVMDGWVSEGLGREYDGYLVKGDSIKEACECRDETNAITNE